MLVGGPGKQALELTPGLEFGRGRQARSNGPTVAQILSMAATAADEVLPALRVCGVNCGKRIDLPACTPRYSITHAEDATPRDTDWINPTEY